MPLTFKSSITNPEKSSSSAYVYFEECLRNAALDAAQQFGQQQGYYEVPEDRSIETVLYRIAYYYFEGKSLVPLNSIMEEELSKITKKFMLFDSIAENISPIDPEPPIPAKTM